MKPSWSDGPVTVYSGDCRDVLAAMEPGSVDAVVCDPPYELGFMGRQWDSRGVAYDVVAWERCLRVLKPGGHLLAFGGTRTYHRMACAVEDAGFEIRDSLHWIYGSGFPKSLDVSKAIDKAAGRIGHSTAELKARLREAFDQSGKTRAAVDAECGFRAANYLTVPAEGKRPDPWVNVLPSPEKWQVMKAVLGYGDSLDGLFAEAQREVVGTKKAVPGVAFTTTGPTELDITAPATEDAARWSGFGSALKPAHEPIVMARKPLTGTLAANVLAHGAGAINVDGCRVGTDRITQHGRSDSANTSMSGRNYAEAAGRAWEGRWPPNILLTHHPDCEPAGSRRVRSGNSLQGSPRVGKIYGDAVNQDGPSPHYADADGMETVESTDGCVSGCPVAEMDAQSGTLKSGSGIKGKRSQVSCYGTPTQDLATDWAGDSGGASRFFPCFRYEAKAPARERPRLADGTAWPTVKPLALMRWLVRLVTPPGGTVLDPFAGTGTTGEAAALEGFRCVLIERDPVALELIRTRLGKPVPAGQDALF